MNIKPFIESSQIPTFYKIKLQKDYDVNVESRLEFFELQEGPKVDRYENSNQS